MGTDNAVVEKIALEQFEASIAHLPDEVRCALGPDSAIAYEKAKYFEILLHVVEQRLGAEPTREFQAKYDPSVNNADEESQSERQALISKAVDEDNVVVKDRSGAVQSEHCSSSW